MAELLNVAGALASVLAFVGSLRAWYGAWRERGRAQQLVGRAQDTQLVDDLARLCGTAQLIAAVQAPEEPGAARYLAEQLCTETVALRGRHVRRAPEGLRRSLLTAEHFTRELARELSEPERPGADRQASVQSLTLNCMTELADARGYAQDVVSSSLAEGS